MMNTFMKELRNRFTEDRHIFYFINKCPQSERELFDYGDVFEMTGKNSHQKAKHLKSFIDLADYVIWHGMIYHTKIVLFSCLPSILRKSIWLIWGIDLYNWEEKNLSSKNKFKNAINRYWRRHVHAIITLMPPDEEAYRAAFPKSKAKCYNIPYPISYEGFQNMEKLRDAKPRQNNKICVQVAHNAHPFNNHAEILQALSKYANENMEVFVPLSYGPQKRNAYIQDVIHLTASLFPNQSKCIHKLMPFDKYLDFMWNMDVSVFYAHRQNALGNITRQLYMGNKVFLSPHSPTYAYLKNLGIEVFNTEDIPKMSFQEFAQKQPNTNARKWIIDTYLPDNVFRLWEKMLVELGGHGISKDYVPQEHHFNCEINNPLYKDNVVNVYHYLKWPTDVSKTKTVAIIGDSDTAIALHSYLHHLNKKKESLIYFPFGFLRTTADKETLIGEKFDLGDYKNYNYDQCDLVYCCEKDNQRRKEIFAFCKENSHSLTSILPINKSSFSRFGEGNIFIGRCPTDVLSSFGNGVIVLDSTIGKRASVGDFVYIGQKSTIGNNVTISAMTSIAEHNDISSSVYIGKEVVLNAGSAVGFGTKIGDGCIIGSNVKMGLLNKGMDWKAEELYLTIENRVTINADAKIGKNVIIEDDVVIGKSAIIGDHVTIGKGATIGDYAIVDSNQIIAPKTIIK